MNENSAPSEDVTAGPGELIVSSLIVAIWLAALAFGYWAGRGIGSVLFN